MRHRHTFDQEPLHVRAAMAYGRSDMDSVVSEILATESIHPNISSTSELY